MGTDGADGLHSILEAGGRTIAESEDSCVVFGMPGAAIGMGAAQFVLDIGTIPARLAEIVSLRRRSVESTGEGCPTRPSRREAGP